MGTLVDQFAGVVCDLDGVVYAGPVALPHAVDSLNAVTSCGTPVLFATNNAGRPPQVVAEHLQTLGVVTSAADVINSSIAGATVLGQELPPGAKVLAVGGPGVALALREAGLEPVEPTVGAASAVIAVLQGYGPDVTAAHLAEVAYAVQSGARWVATNTDVTLPTDRGQAPGNGSLVLAVRQAAGRDPEVMGKPMPVMYDIAVNRLGLQPESVLGIGDRLETDIEGANRAGCASVLVRTGVHDYVDAVAAQKALRPDFVVDDLRALHAEYTEPAGSPQALLRELWRQIDAHERSVKDAVQHMADFLAHGEHARGSKVRS